MKPLNQPFIYLLLFVSSWGYAQTKSSPTPDEKKWKDPTPHTSKFIKVNGVNLNVLDWGGDKPTLILLHGIGESPHIFDDLSYQLSDKFRLIAYAKRGNGKSEVKAPYNVAADVEDLKQLLTVLHLSKVSLLARARGGNEITAFAEKYPQAVNKLIYLDAAYNWSDLDYTHAFEHLPCRISPISENLKTMHTYGSFYHHLWLPKVKWTDGLSSHVQDITYIGADSLVHPVPDAEVLRLLQNSLTIYQRNYQKIKVPVLALFASNFMQTDSKDSTVMIKFNDWNTNYMLPWKKKTIQKLKKELSNVTIVELPVVSNTSMGVIELEVLSEAIYDFLKKQ
jgi:pimeloyl-ACP methyl ester carboxylesterase